MRRSADGKLVICHDQPQWNTIERTATEHLALPTLGRCFTQFATRAFLDIELKVSGMEPQVLAELRKHPPQKGYVVSSFFLTRSRLSTISIARFHWISFRD